MNEEELLKGFEKIIQQIGWDEFEAKLIEAGFTKKSGKTGQRVYTKPDIKITIQPISDSPASGGSEG
jgi:hypothetical protein